MPRYVLVYSGPRGMGETPQEQAELAAAWQGWYGALGASITDPGAPFAGGTTLRGDRRRLEGGESELTGYVAISAADLEAATALAQGCPVLRQGGRVETYEVLEIG